MSESPNVLERVQKVADDVVALRGEFTETISGKPMSQTSQKKSVWGRLETLEGDVDDLKKAAIKAEEKAKEDAARVEKYRAGALLALASSVIGWVVLRVLGGA